MNERFFSLPPERQQAIINAGYKVFSQNSYKKSPMSEIADSAGISKALLFHYFTNKKELYLYLWEQSGEVTAKYMRDYGCYEQSGFFEIMLCGLRVKAEIMRKYPDLSAFVMKAYYEKDEAVCHDIQRIAAKYTDYKTNTALLRFDQSKFRDGLDLKLMYQEMYWATEGYLWEKQQSGHINVDEVERDFIRLVGFWKQIYLKEESI